MKAVHVKIRAFAAEKGEARIALVIHNFLSSACPHGDALGVSDYQRDVVLVAKLALGQSTRNPRVQKVFVRDAAAFARNRLPSDGHRRVVFVNVIQELIASVNTAAAAEISVTAYFLHPLPVAWGKDRRGRTLPLVHSFDPAAGCGRIICILWLRGRWSLLRGFRS
jgi:hypothetical protein